MLANSLIFLKYLQNLLHTIWEKLVYYNFFIALAAVLLTILSAWIFEIEINIVLLLFIFFASTLTYNLDRNLADFKVFGVLFYLNIFCVLICTMFVFLLKISTCFYLSHLACISLLYAIPKSFGKWYLLSLRRIPLLKIFIIGYGWASVTVILPLLEADIDIFSDKILLEFISRFLFIFIITIPFDIGDYTSDKKENIITIPIILGIQNSKIFAFIVGLIFLFLSFYKIYFWTHLVLYICILYLTRISTTQKPKLFYKKYVDGMMHLYFVLYVIVNLILN